MFGFNALRSNERGIVGVLTEERLVLYDSSLAPVCQFSGLGRAQCFGVAGNALVLFEESQVTVMEQRDPREAAQWHRVLCVSLTWLAHDCSVAVRGDEVTVMAASVVGVHVWKLDRGKKSVKESQLLQGRSAVAVQLSSRFAAAATTDGHVAIWDRHEQPAAGAFVWFAESGLRICSLQFSSDETQCAAVCWDGSGALFAHRAAEGWAVARLFSSPLLFSSWHSARPGNPALCVFGVDNVLHVLYRGGLKSHGQEGMNARWISRFADFEGFCRLDSGRSVALEREGMTLRIIKV